MPPKADGLVWTLLIAFAALSVGSCIRLISLRAAAGKDSETEASLRRKSLLVWWGLLIVFAFALLLGRAGLAALFCLASLRALFEFHQIFQRRSMDAPLLALALGAIAIGHYLALAFAQSLWSLWAFPLFALVAVTFLELMTGRAKDYLRTTAGYYWASILIVFGLSHAVATTYLPEAVGAWSAGPVGWCIFLIFLTESNDIAQALVGRVLGRHKITPVFSPGKTWEGLIGGLLVTTLLALLLSPWLTTFNIGRSPWQAGLIAMVGGAIISLCGLLGDLNMSGLKREAGVKDSSTLLPGMGGMIDRIDSLTFTAPAFFYFAIWVT